MTLTVNDSLEGLAVDAARDLEGASAHEIIQWAARTFGERFAVTASMADGVLSHVAGEAVPGITVLFLDTGYHFAETIGTRDAIAATYPVKVETIMHPLRVPEHEAEYGRLYEIDPDLCCAIRKVWPLDRALRPYDAWAGGVRRAESRTRSDTPVVTWDAKRRKVKVNPLATWSDAQVDIRRRTRHPGQPAARDRVHLHRLRAVHEAGRARRGPALRPMVRARQDRMRHPLT
jgi:phosphoadenosine phosphosulfate reductase